MDDDATTPKVKPIRPKHAVCVKCGYEFGGGVALENGYLVCPECAHTFDVRGAEMIEAGRRRRPRRAKFGWMLAGLMLLAWVARWAKNAAS